MESLQIWTSENILYKILLLFKSFSSFYNCHVLQNYRSIVLQKRKLKIFFILKQIYTSKQIHLINDTHLICEGEKNLKTYERQMQNQVSFLCSPRKNHYLLRGTSNQKLLSKSIFLLHTKCGFDMKFQVLRTRRLLVHCCIYKENFLLVALKHIFNRPNLNLTRSHWFHPFAQLLPPTIIFNFLPPSRLAFYFQTFFIIIELLMTQKRHSIHKFWSAVIEFNCFSTFNTTTTLRKSKNHQSHVLTDENQLNTQKNISQFEKITLSIRVSLKPS